MLIQDIQTKSLTFADYNPRRMGTENFISLQESIDTFGVVDPIVVNRRDGKLIIVGGHQRVRAATALGLETVPCVVLNLSPAAEKALNVRLNNRRSQGEDDVDMLSELLHGLDEENLLASGYDFDSLETLQDGFLAGEDLATTPESEKTGETKYTLDQLRAMVPTYREQAEKPNIMDYLRWVGEQV